MCGRGIIACFQRRFRRLAGMLILVKQRTGVRHMLSYQAPAVQKAFTLLKTVAEAKEGLRLTEISNELGFSKSTTHGLIKALLKVGALDQSPNQKKVFLGASFVDLASKSSHYYGISEQVQPVIDSLCNSVDQSVFLGVLSQSRGTIVSTAQASKSLSLFLSPGTTVPYIAGAVGKAFLAPLPKRDVLKIIRKEGLKPYTQHTITDEETYLKELKWVRRHGYALDHEEYMVGVKAVAVNLGNYRSLPLMMWVVGFASILTDDKMPYVVEKTLEASKNLKQVLRAERG